MAGVKGRSGGWRPGAGRKPGTKNAATIEREAVIANLTATIPNLSKTVGDMLTHVEGERQMRRHQAEVLPTILRRLTEIEKHLALRENHHGPRMASTRVFQQTQPGPTQGTPAPTNPRPQPSAKAAAAEALFRQGGGAE